MGIENVNILPKGKYNCPNCGKLNSEPENIIHKTESVFKEEPDPHYSWDEIVKCKACETIYQYENGT